MNKLAIYRLLEAKMLSYTDYADVPVRLKNDKFEPIVPSSHLIAAQIDANMKQYTGEQVFVRSGVLHKLEQAAATLARQAPELQLEVVYGYRWLAIQERLFEAHKKELAPYHSAAALPAAVHRLVAVPAVAGHPAGAAVDIQLTKNGRPLDFGTKIHQFVPDTFVFSPFISAEAWRNRQLLRRIMMQVGFAPFDGEWWHFSYGDKEWACYYHEAVALYEQTEFRHING